MSGSLPLQAHTLSFSYSEVEDRLLLCVDSREGQRLTILATRRLTARLLNALASLVERSSLVARQAPSPLRDDVVLFEHQGALQGGRQAAAAPPSPALSSPAPPPTPLPLLPPALLAAVEVRTKPSHFSLTFRDSQRALATCDVTRAELHRLIQALLTKVADADWGIRVEASWLGAGQQQQSALVN